MLRTSKIHFLHLPRRRSPPHVRPLARGGDSGLPGRRRAGARWTPRSSPRRRARSDAARSPRARTARRRRRTIVAATACPWGSVCSRERRGDGVGLVASGGAHTPSTRLDSTHTRLDGVGTHTGRLLLHLLPTEGRLRHTVHLGFI